MQVLDEMIEEARVRSQLPAPSEARALRILAGWKLTEMAALVAEEAGVTVTPQAVSHWESGSRNPSGARRTAYSRVLTALRRGMAA